MVGSQQSQLLKQRLEQNNECSFEIEVDPNTQRDHQKGIQELAMVMHMCTHTHTQSR